MEKCYYPPKLTDAKVLGLMRADGRDFTYVYGILAEQVGEFACEDGPHPKWQVGEKDNLTTDEAVAAVQAWMAAGREEVDKDHWSVKGSYAGTFPGMDR